MATLSTSVLASAIAGVRMIRVPEQPGSPGVPWIKARFPVLIAPESKQFVALDSLPLRERIQLPWGGTITLDYGWQKVADGVGAECYSVTGDCGLVRRRRFPFEDRCGNTCQFRRFFALSGLWRQGWCAEIPADPARAAAPLVPHLEGLPQIRSRASRQEQLRMRPQPT